MDFELFRFTASTEVEMLLRITFAAVVGGIIGYERRRAARPAGIRTLALVAMGAAAFTVVSIFGFTDETGGEGQLRDPARVAAQVATGVGFIGAGTMIRSGGVVRGLTTAAGIWMSAALGVAAGAGMYVFAFGGALLATMILSWLPRNPGVEELDDTTE